MNPSAREVAIATLDAEPLRALANGTQCTIEDVMTALFALAIRYDTADPAVTIAIAHALDDVRILAVEVTGVATLADLAKRCASAAGATVRSSEPVALAITHDPTAWPPAIELGLRYTQSSDHLTVELVDERATGLHRGRSARLARMIERFAHHWVRVPQPLATGELIDASERTALLALAEPSGAPSASQPASDTTICDLFRAAVAHSGDREAVVCGDRAISYRELADRVDALACYLVARGITPGAPVAIALEPSIDVAVAMLGILEAGGCFVPIDPALPASRVRDILDDSGARFVIGAAAATPLRGGEIIELAAVPPVSGRPLRPAVGAHSPAYLIYTSGTTGAPKGVIVEHHSLVNYVTWIAERYQFVATDRAGLMTSHAYDLGYTTLWTALLTGATLDIFPQPTREDVAAMINYIADHRLTVLKVTPSLLSALVTARAFDQPRCASLRLIVSGGEPVRASDVAEIYDRLPAVLVVNHYGPTETTIGVATHPIERDGLAAFAARPTIGAPIGNARMYITDDQLRLVPAGAIGELVIGGRPVARGYHRRDELTAARFVADPYVSGGTVYRTGDLARWTPDGTIELLGRRDGQVKVRGYRVELADIEHALHRIGVGDAVVIARADASDSRVLCAYCAGVAPAQFGELRGQLAELVPSYMVPTHWIAVAALPRTPNGKLDLAQLPPPTTTTDRDSTTARPPVATATERVVADLWSELLGIAAPELVADHNFFELGGHSLLVLQLLAEVDNRFGRSIEIPAFFRDATIRALATMIDGDAR